MRPSPKSIYHRNKATSAEGAWPRQRYSCLSVSAIIAVGLVISLLVHCQSVMAQSDTIFPTSTDVYRLAPQDKIKLRVIEWRPGTGEYKEWTPLNGEYAVDASGSIAVPLLGNVRAMKLTTEQLGQAIALSMKQRLALADAPDVAVEVSVHRPVYIVGEVQQPGEFPFRPGMTALKLVAIAGGLFRDTTSGPTAERYQIVSERALSQANSDLRRALVRRARLTSEMALVETLDFAHVDFASPAELRESSDTEKLMLEEKRILQARVAGFKSQHSAFSALIELLEQEGGALSKKATTIDQQIEVARVQHDKVQGLWQQKLIPSSVRLTAERDLARLESQMLDLSTTTLRVKQDISQARRNIDNARTEYLAKVTGEMQEIDATIDRLKGLVEKERALLNVALSSQVAMSRPATTSEPFGNVVFMIKRTGPERLAVEPFRADAHEPIQPGDVIIVSVQRPNPDATVLESIGNKEGWVVADAHRNDAVETKTEATLKGLRTTGSARQERPAQPRP